MEVTPVYTVTFLFLVILVKCSIFSFIYLPNYHSGAFLYFQGNMARSVQRHGGDNMIARTPQPVTPTSSFLDGWRCGQGLVLPSLAVAGGLLRATAYSPLGEVIAVRWV